MERPVWAPGEIDLERPSAARVYDYYLGGSHNFRVDREMAEQAIRLWPELPQIMQANRAFLRRTVRFLVRAGVRQFLDIGSGIPTAGNVHEVATAITPDARVIYVDIDPVAVVHGRAILAEEDRVAVVQADLSDPEQILGHPQVRELLDFSEPVAVLLVAVLHFVGADQDPAGIVATLRDSLAPGSYVALSHATHEGQPDRIDSHKALYARTATPMTMRSKQQVTALLGGFDILDPGVVFLPLWRPDHPDDVDDHPERFSGYAAVGHRR